MQDDRERTTFFKAASDSFEANTFIKLVLGKPKSQNAASRCTVSSVLLKGQTLLRFVTRQGTRETTLNLETSAALERLAALIGDEFLSASLFTTAEDVALIYSRKRVAQLTRGPATMAPVPPAPHDRPKAYLVDVAAPYLALLGVTHAGKPGSAPEVKPSMYGKYRQICRFVEIVDQLVATSALTDQAKLTVIDIGSGKGYLTFALHDHLQKRLGKQAETLGLEANGELADQSAAVARNCGLDGLTFETARAEQWAARHGRSKLDILIALHACDTATDDAIFLGITLGAEIIVCAPCCQHELAPQLAARASPIEGLLKYGLLRQRQADLVTDAARALLLEMHGYAVKIIEFVSTEHTSKNLLIAAVRSDLADRRVAAEHYGRLAGFAGFHEQRLSQLLAPASSDPQRGFG